MNKYILAFLLLTLSLTVVKTQSLQQALLFNQTNTASTARSMALGGGMSALGGDFSVVNTNPAGLAIYRRSEVNFSPSLDFTDVEANLAGDNLSDNKTNFALHNVGLVISNGLSKNWRNNVFSVGFNKVADFRENFSFQGNSMGSITDRFLELAFDAQGNPISAGQLDDFYAGPAFDATAIVDLIDDQNNLTTYYTDYELYRDVAIDKKQTLEQRGGINELSLSLAGNKNNKLLMGLSLGIPILNYKRVRTYEEEDTNGGVDVFDLLSFYDSLNVEGVGINIKGGLIYWPTRSLRLGAAIHTPSWYSLTENYDTQIDYTYTLGTNITSQVGRPINPRALDYSFRTPWKFMGSAGYILPKFGLLTAEVIYMNHAKAKFDADINNNSLAAIGVAEDANEKLTTRGERSLEYSIGAEYRINPQYFARLGYNHAGAISSNSGNRKRYSAGLGYRNENIGLDLAYVNTSQTDDYNPYDFGLASSATLVERSSSSNMVMFTLAFRFN